MPEPGTPSDFSDFSDFRDFRDFRPESPEFYHRNPDAVFARLRAREGLHWYEGEAKFWCVTRHADVREASSHPRRFSSAHGLVLPALARKQQETPLELGDSGPMGTPTIIDLDPPIHNLHRKLVMDSFKPRAAAQMEGRLRAIARESLDQVAPGEGVDFVEKVALPLPMVVIAELLGVPKEDHDRFRVWSDAMVEISDGKLDETTVGSALALFAYLGEQLARRRAEPGDDLISTLLEAEIEGQRLSEAELLMFCMILLVGGNETTRTLIAGGTRALLDHPEERAKLLANPQLLPNAIEEMLRYVTPIRSFARKALADTELGGQAIREGDYLVMFYAAANRDRSVFGEDADAFLIDRPTASRHLAFGYGEHLCLGAALARLEARVLFEEMLPRLEGLRYDGDVEPLFSLGINGTVRMPVVFEK